MMMAFSLAVSMASQSLSLENRSAPDNKRVHPRVPPLERVWEDLNRTLVQIIGGAIITLIAWVDFVWNGNRLRRRYL